ncbi:hypothetical protein LJR034_004684 [Caballeronia sp. LjRoot34]|uniref:hypothetical protein n=1 Tax=Caballeronia sp. LjRoot34 TaxID=3342325 RepID=UPI003ECE2533
MMQPIRTDACNTQLGAPRDWDESKDGECCALPIHRDAARQVMHSFWQPSEQDIANIIAGVPIRLTVIGTGHPPVAINVTRGIED